MRCFTGIIPAEEIYTAIDEIQRRFGDNRLEPHITINPPVSVIDFDGWIKSIEDVCSRFTPIDILLTGTGQFGKRTLFISIDAPKLSQLYYDLNPAIKAFEQAQKQEDNRPYHPHLTLARSWCGFTKEDFAQMKVIAGEYIATSVNRFTASALRIYHKPKPQGRFEPLRDIPFGGV